MDIFSPKYKCCQKEPSTLQALTRDFYKSIQVYLEDLLQESYEYSVFGKCAQSIYDKINDFHYLYMLMIVIYQEQQEDKDINYYINEECNVDNGAKYYIDKYNLACIKKHFMCNKFNVSQALQIFGLDPDMLNRDGIGNMYIRFNETECDLQREIFKVK